MKIKATKKWFREEQFKIEDMTPSISPDITIEDISLFKDGRRTALQIDGGGILGIIPAYRLYNMYYVELKNGSGPVFATARLSSTLQDYYGTSTGSIIAAATYLRLNPETVLKLYIENGPRIFQDRMIIGKIFRQSLYKSKYLEKTLIDMLGTITFKQARVKYPNQTLNIAVVSKLERTTIICNYKNTPDMPIYKAVLASSSAPIYFPPVQYKDKVLVDGGTATYNCLLEKALDTYLYDFALDPSEFYIMSLGCGTSGPRAKATKKQIKKAMKANKIKSLKFTFMYGREETITRQVKKLKHLKEELNISADRFDLVLKGDLSEMSETNNINEIVDLIEGR